MSEIVSYTAMVSIDLFPKRSVPDPDNEGQMMLVPKYEDLEGLNAIIRHKPRPEWIKKKKFGDRVNYIPIRIGESLLRETFPAYQVEQHGEPKILGNSVVVSVNVKVLHPFFGWMSYAGVGAAPIQLQKQIKDEEGNIISGARSAIDFENINATGLHKVVPAAMGFAFSNAIKKIGRFFGSELNSKEDEVYK